MQENYRIFLDSRAGLISGTLQLHQHAEETSGSMEIGSFPLAVSDVEFDGNFRRFTGTFELGERSLQFRAEGELEDDVLDVMLHAAGKKMLLTGFLQENT